MIERFNNLWKSQWKQLSKVIYKIKNDFANIKYNYLKKILIHFFRALLGHNEKIIVANRMVYKKTIPNTPDCRGWFLD